ncbi:MAG: rhodanese-like domain-containing protein, partial [Prevotella sp.]
MNCNDFEQEIARVDSVQLVDVRTEEEYKAGHLNNAILMNVKDSSYFNKALKTLTPKKTVAVYCRSGRRSAHAASILAEKG